MVTLMNRLTRSRWLIFVLFILLVPSTGGADLGDILSKVQIYGVVQETYDSNVNLSPINALKLDDYITNVSLGLRFSTLPRSETTGEFQLPPGSAMKEIIKQSRSGIYLDVLPGYAYYAKQTQQNYFSLNGNLDTWYTWDGKLTFRVRDYVLRSEEPLEQNLTAGALPGQLLLGSQTGTFRGLPIYIRNVAQPSLEYRFGREDSVSVDYISNVYRNEDPFFGNSTENYINPRVTYWFNIRHGVFLEYALDLGDFTNHPSMTGNLGRGSYTYRFNPDASIFGEFSFQSRVFAKPPRGVFINFPDYNVYQPTIGFEYKFSPTLSLRARGGYFWQVVQDGSSQTGPVYDIVITQHTQRTTYTLGAQGGYTEDYFTARNLGFAKYHQVIGTISYQLMEKLNVTISGRYQRPEFDTGQIDNIWGAAAGVSYRILRWMTVGLDFSYAQDHSNIQTNSYTDFQGMFRLTGTY